MTITVVPMVEEGCLTVRGMVVLTHVPGNILVSPVGTGSAFLGATFTIPSPHNVFTLGILRGYRLLSLLRVETWWMIPRVGKSASDIPVETQLLLLEAREESSLRNEMYSEDPNTENTFYIIFLPVLDGQFRSTLQGTSSNELQFCIESGDADFKTSQSIEAVIVNSGDNPFELIWDSIKILEEHKGTFCRLENKKISLHLNRFGGCIWDAIYTEVSPQGTREGLQSLLNGGFSPKSVIIDGEWQETLNEFLKESEPIFEGTHDKILKNLALPDGSVLRARYAGLPTRDCLFENHLLDGKSLLKIWNLNMLTGVVGVFNFQGLKSLEAEPRRITISGKVRSLDVEFLEEIAGENWNGECVVYAFNAGLLSKLPRRGKLEVSLETLQCEIYIVSPIRVFGHDFQIAPIGLLDMFNSGEAVEALDCTMDAAKCIIKIRCRGCGRFGAYCNVRPKHCIVDMKEEEFFYNSEDGLLTIKFDGEADSKDIELVYMTMAANDTNSTVMFDSPTSKYLVLFDGLKIETTVTGKAKITDEWIQLILSTHAGSQLVIGMDTEWMLDQNMKTAILQLCVEDKCLIFQLVHMDDIPQSLRSFLMDFDFKFVGVGVMNDIKKLKNEYGLECKNGIDVSTLAVTQWPGRFSSRGLKYLAKELVGLNMKKPKEVCTSEWKLKELTKDQVEYACIDAYASYKIGKKLLIENKEIIPILSD